MAKKVYLAGPIHGRTDAECKDWRGKAAAILGVHDILCIDPMSRDYRGIEDSHAPELVAQDKKWIEQSNVVLANVNVPSWGTAMECLYAASIGKKVVAFATYSSAPFLSPWLRVHCTSVFDSLWSALDGIVFGETEGIR